MVTTNSVVNRPLISPTRADASVAGPSEKLSARKHANPPAPVQADSAAALVSSANGLANKLATNSQANSLAEQIRSTDTALGEIGRTIGKMKQALEGIVKNYPPYPPGSIERAEKLKSFNGLRSLIDRLTFPPEPADFGETQSTAPQRKNYPTVAIENQQVDAGPQGLDIPELPIEASDTAIFEALAGLGRAKEKLDQQRNALSEEAGTIAQEIFPEPLGAEETSKMPPGGKGSSEELAAEDKSLELKKIFSKGAAIGASREHAQLMELVK